MYACSPPGYKGIKREYSLTSLAATLEISPAWVFLSQASYLEFYLFYFMVGGEDNILGGVLN